MSATARSTETQSTRSRAQGRVLLVTDEAATLACGRTLERAGFHVSRSPGSMKAFIDLRETRPHIVVADVHLKGMRTDELTRNVPEGMPLVLVGGSDSTIELRAHYMSLGAFDYFRLPDELRLLVARVEQLVAFQQRIEALRAEADKDYLTGLSNRRRFRTALVKELERWRRYNTPCALLLADVDHLKKINDTHGHSAGDIVIRHVARALVEHSRDNDTAARLGGEEFALLLAGAGSASAFAAAERVRLAVCDAPLEGIGTVSISLGVAACPEHALTERTLYAASDAALYRGKDEGRNRSMLAEDFRT